ncbi:MAG: zinc-ribbon domain-containing protein [Deltaproteobacteria bacterium]|nr:zinc-ribbon domain-containing protein [Deltaproteobacteria bacterium]
METIEIICFQCKTAFEFTVEEQLRYRKMNFDEPRRCPDCRKKRLRPHAFQNGKRKYKKKYDWLEFEE